MRAVVLGCAALAATAPAAAAAPLMLAAPFLIDARVAGQAARLRVEPSAPSMPILHPALAARARLRAGPFGAVYTVGPVRLSGRSAVVPMEVAGAAFRRRTGWSTAAFSADADGALGPGALPHAVVRFDLAQPRVGERETVLPLHDWGWAGMGTTVAVAGRDVRTWFALDRAETLVSAGVGAHLAREAGGRFDAGPDAAVIRFGISRPVRRMALARPLAVGPLAIDRLLVRTGDFGTAAAIPDEHADPDEVVVLAKDSGRDGRLAIGRDALAGCSSLTFDKPAKLIRLRCR